MKRAYRLEVIWRDSMLDNEGWAPIRSTVRRRWGDRIHTVGFVLRDDKVGISLASSVHDSRAAGVVHIPAGCIISRRRVR